MRSLLILTVVAFLSAGAAAQSRRSPLFGTWKLVSLEAPGTDGQVHKADCDGVFVFTIDGKASVQVMYRTPRTGSAYAQGG